MSNKVRYFGRRRETEARCNRDCLVFTYRKLTMEDRLALRRERLALRKKGKWWKHIGRLV